MQRHQQGDLAGALADFEEAARLDPGSAVLCTNCGALRQAMGDLDGALACFEEALRRDPRSAEALNNRGVIRLMRGNLRTALADFDAAVGLSAGYVHALTNRGVARRELGDLNGALADFAEALRISPDHLDAVRNRALARREAGDLAGAAADLMLALGRTPRAAASALLLDIASLHLLRADWQTAIGVLDQALAIDPRFTEAYIHRGNARHHLSDPQAFDDHLRAFRLDGRRYARELVEILHWDLTRDPAAVLQQCARHLAADPDDVVTLTRRGVSYRLLNRAEEARADLERVAATGREVSDLVALVGQAAEELERWLKRVRPADEEASHWLRRLSARTARRGRGEGGEAPGG
jgi:serine/threonine-protein kinase